tara:strand:+ start:133 stop:402 length:270 start_codon:yes stop_codon:yes gene_type:complete
MSTSSTKPELILCPLECLDPALTCGPQADFLEKHSTFFITLIGALSACGGLVLTYFLKSRCNKIQLGCISCERKVIELDSSQIQIQNQN